MQFAAVLRMHYIQSEKVRGLQHALFVGGIVDYYIQSEKVRGLQRVSLPAARRRHYIQSEKVRGLQLLNLRYRLLQHYIQSEKVRGLQQHYASTNSTPINRLFRHFSPPKTKPLA